MKTFLATDHLGSSSSVTNKAGGFHEHIEYFPYGETWVSEKISDDVDGVHYKFTGKEEDPETGLYYFGARYYDPVVSRWVSVDPPIATGEYLPTGEKGKDSELPGMGGVFNSVNLDAYQYAGMNPIKLVDPDGLATREEAPVTKMKRKTCRVNNTPVPIAPDERPVISSPYGTRIDPITGQGTEFHPGTDAIPAYKDGKMITNNMVRKGMDVNALAQGRVSFAGWKDGYGNLVIVDHGSTKDGKKIQTYYAHNNKINVKVGQWVNRGKTIAQMGNTGRSGGPHVHYELRIGGRASNLHGKRIHTIITIDSHVRLKYNYQR